MPDELDLLKGLGRDLAEPDDESVRRARALLEQRIGTPSARSPFRPRWGLALAAAALLIGSGLGFGIASFVTPSGTAGGRLEGFGFVTAQGWNVTQTGSLAQSGVSRAIAANVPLAPGDEARALPLATLRRLEPGGAVIVARLFPRGDESVDERFPLRSLPLRVADAAPAALPPALSETPLVSLRLRAGTGGYNVDARVFFGAPPSPATVARADEQLRRLVVAPGRVTLVVQPRVFGNTSQRMSIYGSVSNAREGQKVVVQFRACGIYPLQFRDVFETTTESGGGFSLAAVDPYNLGISGAFRAVSGDSVSAGVAVQQQAFVFIRILSRGRFEIGVSSLLPFWRRHVLLQRYDRARGRWVNMRRMVLTEQLGGGGPAPPFQRQNPVTVQTEAFRPRVPRGTRIRAVFPRGQAKPCYLAGISQERRT